MKLLVVVLCYKVPDLAIDCLKSLGGEVARVPGTKVVVCENGTGGDAAERIRRAIDQGGWAGGAPSRRSTPIAASAPATTWSSVPPWSRTTRRNTSCF
ncbi:glycosyltransferase family 2 protein [Aquisphaera giovannonii]|uniref:hypothetical protein n=1 Tax=Aquisphaera giovannonii TaxID=406548 RepID=UPI001FE677EA|nr:hypothetical protein [Aquisphaera giovannonii]